MTTWNQGHQTPGTILVITSSGDWDIHWSSINMVESITVCGHGNEVMNLQYHYQEENENDVDGLLVLTGFSINTVI